MADNPQVEVEIADNSSPTLATSALQTTGNSSLSSMDTKATARNTSLSSIDTKLSSQATAANQATLSTQVGIVTETAPASDTASSGLNGRLQRIAQRLTSIFTGLSDGTQQSKLKGNTDGTLIGNVNDSLKVVFSTDPKVFVVLAQSVAIGNGKSMLSLVNTSGSTVKVKIRQIWIKNVQTTGVTGIIANFELNSIVGHSAGTLLTPKAHDSADTLNSSITARTGGTVTTEGSSWRRWLWSSDEWGPGPQDNETNEHTAQNTVPHYQDGGGWKTITLNANEGIHLKQVTNSTAGTFDVELVFTQE